MADPRLPVMVDVRCPDCARRDEAAVLLTVPADLTFAVIPFEARQRGDRLHVCDQCVGCGKRWCVKVLPRAA